MKSLLRHILAFVFLLTSFCICHAQEVVRTQMDEGISRYEMLCEICLNLRTRIRQGEDVSRSEAQAFINRFLEMNKELKGMEDYMTPDQKQQFAAVTQWFSTGERPSIMDAPGIPREDALFSVDIITLPEVTTDISVSDMEWNDIVRPSTAISPQLVSVPRRKYIMLSMSVPDCSYGLTGGYMYGRWGGYASFRSNFNSTDTSYSCLSDGSLSSGGTLWASGNMESGSLTVVAGCLAGLNRWFTAYAGLGYGWRKVAWEDIDGAWAEVADLSHNGIVLDIGLLCSWNSLTLSAGVSTISFKSVSLVFGLGINF